MGFVGRSLGWFGLAVWLLFGFSGAFLVFWWVLAVCVDLSCFAGLGIVICISVWVLVGFWVDDVVGGFWIASWWVLRWWFGCVGDGSLRVWLDFRVLSLVLVGCVLVVFWWFWVWCVLRVVWGWLAKWALGWCGFDFGFSCVL